MSRNNAGAGGESAALSIGIIGCGSMGGALARGLVGSNLAGSKRTDGKALRGDLSLMLFDADRARAEELRSQCAAAAKDEAEAVDVAAAATLAEVVGENRVVVICVKPKDVSALLGQWRDLPARGDIPEASLPLAVSVAAGVSKAMLLEYLAKRARVARVMPNTACLVGRGVSAVCADGAEDAALLERIFAAVGMSLSVESEADLDAITGMSASGIAFVLSMLEALADGGVKMGLSREKSLLISGQTIIGAGSLLLSSRVHPAVLRDQVTSPGGTTIAGLHELEKGGFRGLVISAVEAATRRAEELANGD